MQLAISEVDDRPDRSASLSLFLDLGGLMMAGLSVEEVGLAEEEGVLT